MQMCLTSSKKILDGFEVADKKDLTSERMSGIVADTIVRIYDTNLAKLDGLSLKSWYTFSRILPGAKPTLDPTKLCFYSYNWGQFHGQLLHVQILKV